MIIIICAFFFQLKTGKMLQCAHHRFIVLTNRGLVFGFCLTIFCTDVLYGKNHLLNGGVCLTIEPV